MTERNDSSKVDPLSESEKEGMRRIQRVVNYKYLGTATDIMTKNWRDATKELRKMAGEDAKKIVEEIITQSETAMIMRSLRNPLSGNVSSEYPPGNQPMPGEFRSGGGFSPNPGPGFPHPGPDGTSGTSSG